MRTMKMSCNCLAVTLVLILTCVGQSRTDQQLDFKNVRLISDQPSIYIAFDKRGKRTPLFQGETDQGIWLRLHNNTRWTIYLCTFGVDKEFGDYGIFYDIEVRPTWKTRIDPAHVATGYQVAHVCNVHDLEPGKSWLFSLPESHLAKGLRIKVAFSFSWERYGDVLAGLEPQHAVLYQLPDDPKVRN